MGNRPHFELLLAALFSLGVLLLLTMGGARQESNMARLRAVASAQEITRGAELYEANCRSCHGVNGEGVGEMGPPLNEPAFFQDRLDTIGWQGTLEEYAHASIAIGRITATRAMYAGDGNVVMTAWSQEYGGPLRGDEIDAVVAFVVNWEKTALGQVSLQPLATPTPSAEDLAARAGAGKDAFAAGGCPTCHTVAGMAEGQGGPDLTGIAATAASRRPGYSAEAYLREAFLVPNAYRVEGYSDDLVCGGILSNAQLDDLVSFLLSQQ